MTSQLCDRLYVATIITLATKQEVTLTFLQQVW